MSTVVSVAASWRLSRIEFNLPHSAAHNVTGWGEVLLEQAPDAPAGILRATSKSADGTVVYGTMSGETVSRLLDEVMDDTIETEGGTVVFSTVLDQLAQFMAQWRAEDSDAPLTPALPIPPEPGAAALTAAVAPDLPPPDDEIPPPPEGH